MFIQYTFLCNATSFYNFIILKNEKNRIILKESSSRKRRERMWGG